jgi:hypothetical protein
MTQACIHTHWQVAQSSRTRQNLPKSMAAPKHGQNESTGIQHCIKAIAGEAVKSRFVHIKNFGSGGQVTALKSATALILGRCVQFAE